MLRRRRGRWRFDCSLDSVVFFLSFLIFSFFVSERGIGIEKRFVHIVFELLLLDGHMVQFVVNREKKKN